MPQNNSDQSENKKIKVIITGATGMVGEGVLSESLLDERVEEVLVLTRRSCNVVHPKLKEIICSDFFDISGIENNLSGYDACFFCLGVSSVGKSEEDYYKVTYTLTLNFAETLCRLNPEMTFCYVSGAGTYSSQKGRYMWARVKGKTENDLMKLPFKSVFAFRPAFIFADKKAKNVKTFYKYLRWVYPVGLVFFPDFVCSLHQIGKAMINSVYDSNERKVLEVKDIKALAHKF